MTSPAAGVDPWPHTLPNSDYDRARQAFAPTGGWNYVGVATVGADSGRR